MILLCPSLTFPKRVLLLLAVFLASVSLAYGKTLGYPGADRKLMPVSERVGTERPLAISQIPGGVVQVEYQGRKAFFDADGAFLFELEAGSNMVYSPVADQLIDFSVPGLVSVRGRASGEELAKYAFVSSENKFLGGFAAADGLVCSATFYPLGTVNFDPLTGEILWTDERLGWSYDLLGEGSVVVNYTHLVHLFEVGENQYFGPVDETLHHALSGDLVLPEDANSGWLLPDVSVGGQAVFVSDDVWLVDTGNAEFEQLSLAGRRVFNQMICQSVSGNSLAALTYDEDALGEKDFYLVVWEKGKAEGESLGWLTEWGDPESVASLSVSNDGGSVLFGLHGGSVRILDTISGDVETLVDAFDPTDEVIPVSFGVRSQRLLPDGGRFWFDDSFGVDRILDVDTVEVVLQGMAGGLEFVSSEAALFIGTDWRLMELDLTTMDPVSFGPELAPRIVDVLPIGDDGIARVFFADGSQQGFDVGNGEFVGTRSELLPSGTRILDRNFDLGLLWGSDARLYDLDTGEVLFDLESVLDGGHFYVETEEVVRELLACPYLRAKILKGGTLVALFAPAASDFWGEPSCSFESGKVLVFELEDGDLVAERNYDWREIVESDGYIVGLERIQSSERGSEYRVGVFDLDRNLAEVYGVAADSSVELAPDGRYFAVLSSRSKKLEEESLYEVEVSLREFALEKNGFSEIEATVWTKAFRIGEFELGTPRLLDYQGPGRPAFALALEDQVLELRAGTLSEWKEEAYGNWTGSRLVDRTAGGDLLLLDPFGRLGVYATFIPQSVVVEVAVDEFGYAIPQLSLFELDRIDVWQSTDLKVWNRWDWVPVKVEPDVPVFYRVVEWVEEN